MLIASLYIFSVPAWSVNFIFPDTIKVNTVTVTAVNHSRELPFSSFLIDSSLIGSSKGSDIGRMLQYCAPVIIKRYGTYGLASLSIRGMSGSHTSVIWNGLDVNAPMNGQTDFTTLPVFAVEQMKLSPGGSDLSNISGTIGGTVEMSSGSNIPDGLSVKGLIGGGSYAEGNGGVFVSIGKRMFKSSTKVWFKNAKNDFLFVNNNSPGGPEKTHRTNAAVHSNGALQDFTFLFKRQELSAHLWYNGTYRELPSAVSTVQQDLGENQKDKSLRAALNYKYTGARIKLNIVSGYVNELNIYNYPLADIHSNNRSETFSFKSSARLFGKGPFGTSFNLGDELQRASSLSYENTQLRNMLSASFLTDYSFNNKLMLMAQIREMCVYSAFSLPELTLGASYNIDNRGKNLLKINVSRNTKYPSLNDLCWSPGGNKELKPELSTGGELIFTHSGDKEVILFSDFSISLFDSKVSDLIQWAQGNNSYWEAKNLKTVNTGGVELSATTCYNPEALKLKLLTSYAFTRSVITDSGIANDASVGSQLIYTPCNVVNMVLTGECGIFRMGSSMLYNSRRYTVSDNTHWLKGYLLNDINAGVSLKREKTLFNIDISVDNIFNTVYESTMGYPMPLRTFMLDLLLTFNLKSEK